MGKNTVIRKKSRVVTVISEYFWLSIGAVFVATGLYMFAIPNQFVMGGVTGISIVLSPFLPAAISPATFVLIMNLLLLLLGFAFLGRDFGFKTVYGSLLYSLLGMVIEKIEPLFENGYPLTAEDGSANLLLELALAVVLPAIGSAIVFYYNGSGGGTDIIALILKKYTHMESGKALVVVDFLIMLVSFTYGVEIGLLSALGLFAKSFIVDKVIHNMNLSKYCIIVTTFPEEIADYISKTLNRGGTMWKGQGVYTREEKTVFIVVMNARQINPVRKDIKNIDEHAFIIVEDTSDIIGNGFRALI